MSNFHFFDCKLNRNWKRRVNFYIKAVGLKHSDNYFWSGRSRLLQAVFALGLGAQAPGISVSALELFCLILNVRGHFRSYFRLNLNVRVTLSELGARKSFLEVFFSKNLWFESAFGQLRGRQLAALSSKNCYQKCNEKGKIRVFWVKGQQ